MANEDTNVNLQQAGVRYLGGIQQAIQAAFPRVTGTFTFTAAATAVVPETTVTSNSRIFLFPNNALAASLVGGTRSPYISVRTTGASFTVATANAAAATGGEIFQYFVSNPS